MPYVFEHLGVAVCAATGALAGRGKRVDLFGVVVLALVTAVGGGTLRDLVLGATPVFWVRDGSFVVTAVAVALLTFAWGRLGKMPHGFLSIADAFGLALFTTVGTEHSLAHGASPVVAVALAWSPAWREASSGTSSPARCRWCPGHRSTCMLRRRSAEPRCWFCFTRRR